MTETPTQDTPDNAFADVMFDQPRVFEGPDDELLEASQPSPEELRALHAGWLARRNIDPASTPQLTMDVPAFNMFRHAPEGYLGYVRECYGIPQGDQANCRFVLIDVGPDSTGYSPGPKLVEVSDVEFGTEIDMGTLARDFEKPATDPNDPSSPDRLGGALRTVDISETLYDSEARLETFARSLMDAETADPFSSEYGDIGVRAGGLAPGQQDAFVWAASPLTKSLELAIAFPGQYDSVCIVRGERREAANGKPGMAQIDNPREVLKIEGDNLEALKRVYHSLYSQPDFALTEVQRQQRDMLFNHQLASLISNEARNNRARRDDMSRRRQPLERQRPLPR